jgi:hypothetical protein
MDEMSSELYCMVQLTDASNRVLASNPEGSAIPVTE